MVNGICPSASRALRASAYIDAQRVVDVEEDAGRSVGVRGEVFHLLAYQATPSVVSTNVSDRKPLIWVWSSIPTMARTSARWW